MGESFIRSRDKFCLPFTPTPATYHMLMKAWGSDYHHGKAVMDEMKTVGISPHHISWSILIDICGSSGNYYLINYSCLAFHCDFFFVSCFFLK